MRVTPSRSPPCLFALSRPAGCGIARWFSRITLAWNSVTGIWGSFYQLTWIGRDFRRQVNLLNGTKVHLWLMTVSLVYLLISHSVLSSCHAFYFSWVSLGLWKRRCQSIERHQLTLSNPFISMVPSSWLSVDKNSSLNVRISLTSKRQNQQIAAPCLL